MICLNLQFYFINVENDRSSLDYFLLYSPSFSSLLLSISVFNFLFIFQDFSVTLKMTEGCKSF